MSFKISSFCYLFLSAMVLFSALCYGQENYFQPRATYYGSPDCLGTPTGACGYGEYGRTVNDGLVTGVSRLFRNGTGCGACYQVKCTIPAYCNGDGVKVVVTDYGEGDRTDFILSTAAYARLARPDMAEKLFSYGVVNVEFKRIPCRYNYNLFFKVHERSNKSQYLAIVAIYQPGSFDITAVQVWQEDCQEWRPMRRAFGAVFDIPNPPEGSLTLRYESNFYGEVSWVQVSSVIPADWKAGYAYDTGIST